ncbi:hypothetical protein RI367_006022 [Sorochytrium milnesiophthora]
MDDETLFDRTHETLEVFTIDHNKHLAPSVLQALRMFDKAVQREDFARTFLHDQHDTSHDNFVEALRSWSLRIVVTAPRLYNRIDAILHPDDAKMDTEYGWFDPRVSQKSIFINLRWYQATDDNVREVLPILAFFTAAHELQHLLYCRFDKRSPVVQSPFLFDGQALEEAGVAWEIDNIGGLLGAAVRHEGSFVVETLQVQPVRELADDDGYLGEEYLKALAEVMMGTASLPLPKEVQVTVKRGDGLVKRSPPRRCLNDADSGPLTTLIKVKPVQDRRGRK